MSGVRAGLAALIALAACRARPEIASCDDDLRGVYVADGAPWMLLDDGDTLAAYPLVPDVPAAAGLEVAPRGLQLARSKPALAGALHRRYLQGAARCDATAAVRVTRCSNAGLELTIDGDPMLPAPLSMAPCQLAAAPTRTLRWDRR